MSWNRRQDNQPVVKENPPKFGKGFVAGFVVVLLALGAIVFVMRGNDKTYAEKAERKPAKIKEATPAAAPKAAEEKKEPEKPKELPPQRVGEIRNGKILMPHGRLHTVRGYLPTNAFDTAKLPYQIFDHMSENVIAGLLTIRPGQTLVGTPRYKGQLTKDFLESLTTPIIPTQTDSDYERELKKAVNAAKIELKAAYDRGEDIEQIILNERKELQKLAAYKEELKSMTIQGMDSAETAEEMQDYIDAANKILESKGIAPMENLSAIARIKLRMKDYDTKEKKR